MDEEILWYDLGYRWFCLKLWVRERRRNIPWRIAWLLPRQVALMAYVRVSSCCGDVPADYDRIYKAWEAGAGK